MNSIYSGIVEALTSILAFIGIWLVVFLAMAIFNYIFSSYTLMHIGRKAGLTADWMAFIPFVKDYYTLQIAGGAKWRIIFFKGTGLLCEMLLSFLFALINPVLGMIVMIVWICAMLYVLVTYTIAYYQIFGLHPILCLLSLVPLGAVIIAVLDVLLAFTDLFHFNSAAQMRPGSLVPVILSSKQRQTAAAPSKSFTPSAPQGTSSTGRIVGIRGMYQGSNFTLTGNDEIIFGRDAALCNLIFDQDCTDISRKHCAVRFNSGNNCYYVTDFSSSGTYSGDSSRIPPNVQTAFPRGTLLYLGNPNNMFRLD